MTRGSRLALARAAAWLVVACGHGRSAPQAPEEHASFVRLYRGDTVVVERVRRTRQSLVGELYLRPPNSRPDSARVAYRASLAPDGRVQRVELTVWRIRAPLDAAPLRRWVTEFGADSVISREYSGTSTTPYLRKAYVARGPVMPHYGPSDGMLEAITMWARIAARSAARIDFQIMPLASRTGPYDAYIEWVGRDSAIFVRGQPRGNPIPVALDRAGRLIGERRGPDFVERRTP